MPKKRIYNKKTGRYYKIRERTTKKGKKGQIKGLWKKNIYYIDFLDALHLRTAIDVECDYFVTKDSELRKRAQALLTKKIINEPIKISTPSGILKIV